MASERRGIPGSEQVVSLQSTETPAFEEKGGGKCHNKGGRGEEENDYLNLGIGVLLHFLDSHRESVWGKYCGGVKEIYWKQCAFPDKIRQNGESFLEVEDITRWVELQVSGAFGRICDGGKLLKWKCLVEIFRKKSGKTFAERSLKHLDWKCWKQKETDNLS